MMIPTLVRRRIGSGLLVVTALAVVPTSAQEPPQTLKPPTGITPAPDREKGEDRAGRGQQINIRVDVRIADHRGAEPKVKTVSLTAADRERAKVRSHIVVPQTPGVVPQTPGFERFYPINVDARPWLEGGKIRLALTLTYDFPPGTAAGASEQLKLVDEMVVLLDNAKPLVVAESTDALTDRKVSVEVTATLLR